MDFDFNIARLWENYGKYLIDIGQRAVIVLLIIAGGKIVISISRRLPQKAVTEKLKLDENLTSVLRMAVHYGVIIICLIMILDVLGINTGGLIALLGAAGVAVGFSLKDTLGNIAAGIVILFLRPFRKGDFIECGSLAGSVCEMGLFAATLETPDGVYITAPNSILWGVPLKNYSYNPRRRMDVTVFISYSDSIDLAFRILNGIISEESRFLNDPPGQVMVQSFGESGIGITLRAWVKGADYWQVYWEQMKNVKEKIQEAGLTISVPKRDIRLINDFRDHKRDPKTEGSEYQAAGKA